MILRNATVIVIADPPKRAVLALTPDRCLYMEAPLGDGQYACNELTAEQARGYFEGPGMDVNAEFSKTCLAEMDRLAKESGGRAQ